MNQAMRNAISFTLVGAWSACSAGHGGQANPNATPPAAGTHSAAASGGTSSAGTTATPSAGTTATSTAGSSALPTAGVIAAGTAGKVATPSAGVAGAPIAGTMATALDGGQSDAAALTELPLELTNVDVTNDTKRRFGAPHVAVNPKNPDNIVVLASSNFGYTRACVPAPKGSDCEMISAGSPFLTQPRGFYKTPGFMDIGVFTSFDRGKTFKQIDVSMLVPPGHREVNAKGEGPIAATADGNFYIAFNAINWGSGKPNRLRSSRMVAWV
jgi:hypothetical protein